MTSVNQKAMIELCNKDCIEA